VTILFCSHSMYQVESLCTRAVWLKNGFQQKVGDPATVILAYENDLNAADPADSFEQQTQRQTLDDSGSICRISRVKVMVDGRQATEFELISSRSHLAVLVEFNSAPELPCPSVAVAIKSSDGRFVTSATTFIDRFKIEREPNGAGRARITFAELPLLKGTYSISTYLMCEGGVYIYEHAHQCASLNVRQETFEQGIVTLPHSWD